MYPIFITDDAEAEVEIKSLPGQKRCTLLRLQYRTSGQRTLLTLSPS